MTSTIVEWLPVFTSAACCDTLINSLEYCRQHKALKIYAWVILDTHFHAILSAPELPKVLHHLKSFTAKQIVAQLPLEGRDWLLNQLQYFRAAHKSTHHQVWQEGDHPQAILCDEMLLQKMEYLHNNPVKRGWVSSPEHWRYSSAHEWLPGAIPVFHCDRWE